MSVKSKIDFLIYLHQNCDVTLGPRDGDSHDDNHHINIHSDLDVACMYYLTPLYLDENEVEQKFLVEPIGNKVVVE